MSHTQDYLIIEQKMATLERLDDIIFKLKSEGMSLKHAIALESIQPSVLFDSYNTASFTKEPSEWLRDVALEKADYLKLGVLGSVLAALIAFIIKLFRGRKTSSANDKKDMDNAKKDATAAEETFTKARRKAAEEDTPGAAVVSPERTRQIYEYLRSINISEDEAKAICTSPVTMRDYFFFKDRYREDVFQYAMQGCSYEIILSENYLVLQDDLKAVVQYLVPEAKARGDYIEKLAEYSKWMVTFVDNKQHTSFPERPLYSEDVGILRRYLSDTVNIRTSPVDVTNAFNERVSNLFTPRGTPSKTLLTATEFSKRVDAVFDDLVKAAGEYNDYYITTGIRKVDLLRKHVDAIARYKASPNYPERAKAMRDLQLAVTEDLRVTARLASTIIMIRERALKLTAIVEDATKTLHTATAMIETLRKELKVGSMFTLEDAGMFDATPLSGSLGSGIYSAPAEEPIVPEDDFIKIEDMVDEAHALESIRLEIEATGTVNRELVKSLPKGALALATRTYSLEQYTYEPSTIRYNVVMESIISRSKEIVKSIIKYIREKIEALVAWFNKRRQRGNAEEASKVDDYIKTFSRGLELTRNTMANLSQIITSEQDAQDILSIVTDSSINAHRDDTNPSLNKGGSGTYSKSNPESNRYTGAALFDYALMSISKGKLRTFTYDLMDNTTGKERPFVSALGDELARLSALIYANCDKIELASKGKGEMIFSQDLDSDNKFIATVMDTFTVTPMKSSSSPEQYESGLAAIAYLQAQVSILLAKKNSDRYLSIDTLSNWQMGTISKDLEKIEASSDLKAIDARSKAVSTMVYSNQDTSLEVIEGLKLLGRYTSIYTEVFIMGGAVGDSIRFKNAFAKIGSALSGIIMMSCSKILKSSQVSPDMKEAVEKLMGDYMSSIKSGKMDYFFYIAGNQ